MASQQPLQYCTCSCILMVQPDLSWCSKPYPSNLPLCKEFHSLHASKQGCTLCTHCGCKPFNLQDKRNTCTHVHARARARAHTHTHTHTRTHTHTHTHTHTQVCILNVECFKKQGHLGSGVMIVRRFLAFMALAPRPTLHTLSSLGNK